MFEPFQKFLNRSANHYGIGREVKAAQVCHNFRELVVEMFAKQSSTLTSAPGAPSHSQDPVNIPTFGKSESKLDVARESSTLPSSAALQRPDPVHSPATPTRLSRTPRFADWRPVSSVAPAVAPSVHQSPDTAPAHPSSAHSQRPNVTHSPASIPPKLVTPASLARGPLDQFISSGSFKDGLLTVDVASPAWAQEVLMRKPQILEALNRKAGFVIVKNLRTRIKQNDSYI